MTGVQTCALPIYGDTIIENKFFTPERNSLIYFKSNIFHAGMFPQINKRRIIINAILQI